MRTVAAIAALVAAVVALAGFVGASKAKPCTPAHPCAPAWLAGTIDTLSTHLSEERAAGVDVAEVDVGWDQYEPTDGGFSSSYAAAVSQRVAALRAAGFKVVLGLALHYPPAWVFGYANSRFVNQFGGTAGEANLVFNQTLRGKAAALISRLNQDVGLGNFYAIRVTSGGDAEAMYPGEDADGVHLNGYWAYDATAQATSPFPGWKPGQTVYNGQPFTTAKVQQWYDWYLAALVGTVNWQIQTYKSLGYTGSFQVLTPGLGSRPGEYTSAINHYLDGTDDYSWTMGRGAVWDKLYAALPDKTKVVAYVSSLADGSGSPADNLCQSSDSSVSITDPQINGWSAARWISYVARRNSLPISGENPGGGANYGLAMMQKAAQQTKVCGLQAMLWARDANLYDGVSGVTLQDYANTIATYR